MKKRIYKTYHSRGKDTQLRTTNVFLGNGIVHFSVTRIFYFML